MIGTYIFIFIVVVLIATGLFTVKQQTIAIIERFGKFQSIRNSGLQLKIPLVDKVSGRVSLRVQQLDVIVETKTKDDVFVHLKISVQLMQSKCCVQFILSFAVQYLLHGLPQFIIFGNRSSDLNQLFGYRMNKFNVSGMQTNAAIRI